MPYGKLGKLAPRHDPRTLMFAVYATLPTPPKLVDWTPAVAGNWPMMKNDQLGDCTIAAAGHLIELWTANTGKIVVPADADIVTAYAAVSGYDPATGEGDGGAVELDVLNYWRSAGIAGHKIAGYVSVNPKNQTHVQQAIDLFGGLYLGMALPNAWQGAPSWSQPDNQDGDNAPGSWGGHAVPAVAYNGDGLTVITWGEALHMTWGAVSTYCDEAYAIVTQDWIEATGKSPSGFDLSQLLIDLKSV